MYSYSQIVFSNWLLLNKLRGFLLYKSDNINNLGSEQHNFFFFKSILNNTAAPTPNFNHIVATSGSKRWKNQLTKQVATSGFGLVWCSLDHHTKAVTHTQHTLTNKQQRFLAAGDQSNWQQMGTLAPAWLTSSQCFWPDQPQSNWATD